MSSSNFVSHFRNAFPSFRKVSLSFSPIAQKSRFRTLGLIIGVVAACGFGIKAHAAADTVQLGAVAPNFTLPSQEDKPCQPHRLQGYRFVYKHEVDVQRDAADVVTLLASGESEKMPHGSVVAISDKWFPVVPRNVWSAARLQGKSEEAIDRSAQMYSSIRAKMLSRTK